MASTRNLRVSIGEAELRNLYGDQRLTIEYVSIVTASRRFAEWLRTTIRRLRGVSGSLTIRKSEGRRDMFCLKYVKAESLSILRWIYHSPQLLCLERKRAVAALFLGADQPARRRGPGRPMVV